MSLLGATQSIVLIKNYTVFQNDTPAMFYCYGSGYENGAVVVWILNGTGYGSKHLQRGITYDIDTPIGDTVSSRLFIPSNSAINNNTEVKCKSIDTISNIVLTSLPANLTIQGECCTTPWNYTTSWISIHVCMHGFLLAVVHMCWHMHAHDYHSFKNDNLLTVFTVTCMI